MKRNRNLYLLLFTIIFQFCADNSVYKSYKDFENGWKLNDTVFFKFRTSVDKKCDIQFHIRNDNDYQYSNLFLIASLEEDNYEVRKDTLEYLMADKEGKLLGRRYGNIRESFLTWVNEYDFKSNSDYLVTINHAMRKNGEEKGIKSLPGVITLGIKVSEKIYDNE